MRTSSTTDDVDKQNVLRILYGTCMVFWKQNWIGDLSMTLPTEYPSAVSWSNLANPELRAFTSQGEPPTFYSLIASTCEPKVTQSIPFSSSLLRRNFCITEMWVFDVP